MKKLISKIIATSLIIFCGSSAVMAGHESISSCSINSESTIQLISRDDGDTSCIVTPANSEHSSSNENHSNESHQCHLGHCMFIMNELSVITPYVVVSGVVLRVEIFSSIIAPVFQRPPLS